MSDPVSNVEIEDVLSSIRRLVSEENRPALRRTPKDKPHKPTRLVLTPSLLVPDSMSDEPVDETAQHAEDEPADHTADTEQAVDSHRDRPESAEEVSEAEADTSVAPEIDAAADDFADVSADDSTDDHTGDSTPDSAGETEPEPTQDAEADAFEDPPEVGQDSGHDPEQDTGHDTGQDPVADSQATQAPWIDPDATLFETAVSAGTSDSLTDDDDDDGDQAEDPSASTQEDTFSKEPDGQPNDAATSGDSDQSAPVPPDWWEASVPDADTSRQETTDDQEGGDQEDAVQSAPADPAVATVNPEPADPDQADADPDGPDPLNTTTLSDKIAALEAKIGQTQDQWEPDGETDDDYAGTPVETIEWQDHNGDAEGAEADTTARTTTPESDPEIQTTQDTAGSAPQQASPQYDDDILDILPEDDTVLDEESLRELVADIVRQELQGALGERITRNVRKLVRREIHRALTAQELD